MSLRSISRVGDRDAATASPGGHALPPGIVERARAHQRGEIEPVAPRDAATVVLVRPALARPGADTPPGGLEVYLLRRVSSMAFAAGMHAFPGGSVDPRDRDRDISWAGPAPQDWADALQCDVPLARALVCAAVRETFEESGVLLAGASGQEIVLDTWDAGWEHDRQALVDRSLAFAELLDRRQLVLRTDLLRPWAHWITPEFEPRRFDTRFFVAAMPAGQHTRDVGGEADRVTWMPVGEAVRAYADGNLPMLPPTAATLRELAACADIGAVLAAQPVIEPVQPRPVWDGGEDFRLVVDTASGVVPADTPRALR